MLKIRLFSRIFFVVDVEKRKELVFVKSKFVNNVHFCILNQPT